MPKRKRDSDCDRIERKIRKLEKKLARKQRRRRHSDSTRSNSDSLSSRSLQLLSEQQDYEVRSDPGLFDNDEVFEESSRLIEGEEQGIEPGPSCHDSQVEKEISVSSVVVIPPEPAVPSTSSVDPVTLTEAPETEAITLDNELLDILGVAPTTDKKYGKDIQKDLSIRLQHWATVGLDKDLRKELRERHLTPENCKLIDPPILNAEIKAAISSINEKRDKAMEGKQNTLASAISCLGEAITLVMSLKEKDTTLLKLLMDSARIICDCQHADTITRRKFVLGGIKHDIREQIQNAKVDKYLFGENLADILKAAKAVSKTGIELKPSTSKAPPRKQTTTTTSSSFVPRRLNWQNPGPVRRPTGPPRMRQPAPTSMHNPPYNSSKQSQNPQRRPGNTRR